MSQKSKRRRWLRAILIAVVAVMLAMGVTCNAFRVRFDLERAEAISPAHPQRRAEVIREADDVLTRFTHAAPMSGVVLIAEGDDILLERVFGTDGRGAPLTATSKLTFGSLPKQLTGYLVQRLVDRKQLRLDQSIGSVLTELAGSGAGRPTIHQLLHMTSGLPNSVDLMTNLRLQLSDEWMPEAELLERVRGYELAFEPGTAYLYSNVGFRLLAIAATRVTSASWPDLLAAQVLEPAGMTGAGLFGPHKMDAEDVTRGQVPYRCFVLFGDPCLMTVPRWNYSALWGAGAMYASARDWLAWSRFLRRLMVEDAALFARYTKPDLEDYGSGIGNKLLEAVDGSRVRVYSHSGGDPGHYGYFAFLPATDVTLVVLANADYASLGNYELGPALRDLLAGLPYERVKR